MEYDYTQHDTPLLHALANSEHMATLDEVLARQYRFPFAGSEVVTESPALLTATQELFTYLDVATSKLVRSQQEQSFRAMLGGMMFSETILREIGVAETIDIEVIKEAVKDECTNEQHHDPYEALIDRGIEFLFDRPMIGKVVNPYVSFVSPELGYRHETAGWMSFTLLAYDRKLQCAEFADELDDIWNYE